MKTDYFQNFETDDLVAVNDDYSIMLIKANDGYFLYKDDKVIKHIKKHSVWTPIKREKFYSKALVFLEEITRLINEVG